jgi:hypothetical protein
MGMPVDPDGMIGGFNDDLHRWVEMANETVEDAARTGNPQLVGDAILARSNIMFVHCASVLLNAKIDSRPVDLEPVRKYFIPDVEQAIRLYQRSWNLDGELQAKILLANFLDLIGGGREAAAIAAEVLPVAKALRLEKTVRDAEGHVGGMPFHRRKEAEFDAVMAQDPDVMMAGHDDEKIEVFAKTSLEAMALSPDRLPNVRKEASSLRDIAQERLDWCRHIDLIQDTRHTLLRATLHALDPDRFCVCLKHGFRSAIGSPDWRPLVTTFKQVCCTLCPDRSPKGRGPVGTSPVIHEKG